MSESFRKIRVLIVDDHPIVRRGLRAVLSAQDDIEVADEAADGATAVAKARALRPDVVLMDVLMPGMDGVEATMAIRESVPEASILVLTSAYDSEKVLQAVKAGALGYHLKDSPPEALVRGIREVHKGTASLHPAAASAIVGSLGVQSSKPNAVDQLSKREREVLDLVGAGLSNKQIAAELFVTQHTVAKHVSRILDKLNLASRTQAALLISRTTHG